MASNKNDKKKERERRVAQKKAEAARRLQSEAEQLSEEGKRAQAGFGSSISNRVQAAVADKTRNPTKRPDVR